MKKPYSVKSPAKVTEHVSLPCTIDEALKLIVSQQLRRRELEEQVSELQDANKELVASLNRCALLSRCAPVGYLCFDRAGCIQTINLTAASLLGVDRDNVNNQPFKHFVATGDRQIFAQFLQATFACREKIICRVKLIKGGSQPVYVRIDAMSAESGEECYAAVMDITERTQSEESLRESEYNLAKAQSMSHVGSWRSDPLTGEVRASDEFLRIMRLSREEATPEVLTQLIHPEDRLSAMALLRRSAEQGNNYEIEHRLLLRDGTSKWVYTIVEPAVNIARQVVILYGTTQDITERKQSEVMLRNKKNELQAIFDSVNDGVIVFDHKGSIQHLNHMCPKFFPLEMFSGGRCGDIFHPDVPFSPHNCPVEMALRGEHVETSMVYAREGQNTRYIDITANPINDEFGEKTRALVFFRDVTLKRLHEMQMIHTEKMSSIGVLATGIAHEINNPLTSVAGYAEALLRRFRDEPSLDKDSRLDVFQKYLEVIVREAYHCKGIIGSLLNFGRKSEGMNYAVDLNVMLLEIIDLLKNQSNYEEREIITDLTDDMPTMLGDQSALRQVFMNLLINACQAIKGGGQVELSTRFSTKDQVITVVVSDTGFGITPDIIDRIWDPFFTTKCVGEGVGLGLALTYNIVKRHGGEISVKSTFGEGSQFTVNLPVLTEQSDTEQFT